MRRAILAALFLCAAAASAGAGPRHWRPTVVGVQSFDPTSPGLHEYTPPTPASPAYANYGNAYFGAGYVEYLFSGGRAPRLPPYRVYVGPLETVPYSNRRLRLREGMSPRAGVYVGLP
jgi:hypothetical protein